MKKFWKKLWVYFKPFTNWKFLISFGIAWMITNGWCYLFMIFGKTLDIGWMFAVGTAYAAFLYMPFTPEKLITIPMAMFFQKILFRKDEKLQEQFLNMKLEAKEDWNSTKFYVWKLFHTHYVRINTFNSMFYNVKTDYLQRKIKK